MSKRLAMSKLQRVEVCVRTKGFIRKLSMYSRLESLYQKSLTLFTSLFLQPLSLL